jgi:CHAT domain-containing protein/tetratricopeptide (TPR) repeat protein
MTISFPRLAALAALLWCASALSADESRVRETLVRFAHAYTNGDTAAMLRLWADDAPALRPFRIQFEGLHLTRCVTGRGVVIGDISVDGDRASGAMTLAVEKRHRESGALIGPAPTPLHLQLQLVRRGDAWLIRDVTSAEAGLAAEIAAAAPAERDALLAAHRELAGATLVRELHQIGVGIVNGQTPAAAGPLAEIARGIARDSGDLAGEALATSLLGVVARLGGDVDGAAALTKTAVDLARASGDPDALSRAIHTRIAALQAQNRDSVEAQALVDEMVRVAEWAEDRVHSVRALNHRVGRALRDGDLLRARAAAEQVEEIRKAVGDEASAHVFPLTVAGIYLDQDNYELALHHAQGALAITQRLQSDKIGRAHALLGQILARLGRLDEAEKHLRAAIDWVGGTGDIGALALAHNALAEIHARNGNLAEAECEERVALQRHRDAGTLQPTPRFTLIAERALDDDNPRLALRLALEEAAGEPRYVFYSLAPRIVASQAYRKLGMNDAAESILLDAIALQQDRFDAAGAEEQQVRIAAQAADAHRELADLLAERGQIAEALHHAELGKSRVLLSVLRQGRGSIPMTDADRATEQRLEAALAATARALAAANDTSQQEAFAEELMHHRHELASFRDGLYVRQPRLRVDRGAIDVPPLDALAATLPPNGAFVEFMVDDDDTHVFVLRPGANGKYALTHRRLEATAASLRALVASFAAKMQGRNLRFRAEAATLYAMLLAPVEDALAGATTVCIVPDDALWQVPFAALIDGHGRYVIERHALSVVPSMSVLAAMQHRARDEAPGMRTLFAVGNPKLARETRREVASFYRNELGDLPEAEKEAEALGALYGRNASTVLTGERAAEARAKTEAERHRILHFATHGILDDVHPMYSRLVLARDGSSATDDGYLEAREIMQLDLHADLAVLSACDTARGAVGGGEGVIGLTWAFFVAGVRATVATQWKISSRSATRLAVDFHSELLRRDRHSPTAKAEALRHAQLALMKQPEYAHPFYWAPFVLYGE